MQQYREIKAAHPGVILFFRLGDFYEMFGEDAVKAAPILEVVLTRRQDVPMCGVPYHAVNSYIRKLISRGEKVAVCEQLEEPRPGVKIVKRGVIRIITPGTILEDNLLEARRNNFLTAVLPSQDMKSFGVASVDISTGEFTATETSRDKVANELFRLSPGELIIPQNLASDSFVSSLAARAGSSPSPLDGWHFEPSEADSRLKNFFKVQSLKPLGLEGRVLASGAAGAALAYVEKTQVGSIPPVKGLRFYSLEEHMLLDETAIKNLELLEGASSRSKENSLLGSVDMTLTPMGARMLRQRIVRPLLSAERIRARQDGVAHFMEDGIARRQARADLKHFCDIERVLGRLAANTAGPREISGLRHSLSLLGKLSETAPEKLASGLASPEGMIELISGALADEPPATLKDGGVIRDGYSPELDELRTLSRDAKKFISELEAKERERTGIASLKVGYTSVFGYYIEVTKTNLPSVPQEYIRKQTVANGERFVTPELKALEEKLLSAEEKILRLENRIFSELRAKLLAQAAELQAVSRAVAGLDVFSALAECAAQRGYVRPAVDESRAIDIKDGRHPVIENAIKSGTFVPNDLLLDPDTDQIIILTGPNMSGKSTWLRQAALLTVLAQAGSYVPASSARIGVVDRIFTRIGASDNLAGGESTFMVEMHETANILNQFTDRSLLILDEVGRGTSTYDGISIARSAVEYLASSETRPKVLFATHYFELTGLPGKYENVKNFNVSVKEWQGDVVFLHKIAPGPADRSYGIHVAQLAGLPKGVVERAKSILAELERGNGAAKPKASAEQPELFESSLIFQKFLIELKKVDTDGITPLDALKLLSGWKKEYLGEDNER